MNSTRNILIIGAATVGAAAALALARLGRSVVLIDRNPPRELAADAALDPRVVAVSPASMQLLRELGAARHLQTHRIAPFYDMLVVAGRARVEFRATEHGLENLGWIAELSELDQALWRAVESERRIETIRPTEIDTLAVDAAHASVRLSDGREVNAAVLLGADGARSRVRVERGIESTEHHYNQRAIVTHLETEKLNPGIAWQRFTELGPMALLSLPEGRSSLVWSVHDDHAARLTAMADEEFIAALTEHAGEQPFGAFESIERRHAIALVRRQSARLAAGRVALLGDAARTVHPLAGQGLNLGLGDVAALIEALADWKPDDDPDARLARYARRRGSDARLVAGGIHLFNEIRTLGEFGNLFLGAGFSALRWTRAAREIFVQRACGLREMKPAIDALAAAG